MALQAAREKASTSEKQVHLERQKAFVGDWASGGFDLPFKALCDPFHLCKRVRCVGGVVAGSLGQGLQNLVASRTGRPSAA
jgi:hypothetical protein